MDKVELLAGSVIDFVKEYSAMPCSVRITKQVVDEMIESLERRINQKMDRDAITIFGIPVIIDDSVDGWKLVSQ